MKSSYFKNEPARVLILHPNFPAQFRSQSEDWANMGHKVKFMCQTHYGRQIRNVERICLKGRAGHQALLASESKGLARHLKLGEQYAIGFAALKSSGWEPDLVLSHSGWGCGLFAANYFPSARRISYNEWFFNNIVDEVNSRVKVSENETRNIAIAAELACSDIIVSPTRWQRSQLPKNMQESSLLIYDSIDTFRFRPMPELKSKNPLLTYGTRGMEKTRKFDEFIKGLPAVLNAWPTLEVEIAGDDKICYGGGGPDKYNTYGEWAQYYLASWINSGRVRFVGCLPPGEYEKWLCRSWIHVYLSIPYVVSWSLLEAMCSSCCILTNNVHPILEFCNDENAIIVNDTFDANWIVDSIGDALTQENLRQLKGARARATIKAIGVEAGIHKWRRAAGLSWSCDKSGTRY